MFGWLIWLNQLSWSGLEGAVWNEVWRWGTGVGVIILLLAAAYFLPGGTNKLYLLTAAAVVAILLVFYGFGQKDERAVCEARIKYIYLKAHPKLHVTAKNWRVDPNWYPGRPAPPKKPVCDGPYDTRCWSK